MNSFIHHNDRHRLIAKRLNRLKGCTVLRYIGGRVLNACGIQGPIGSSARLAVRLAVHMHQGRTSDRVGTCMCGPRFRHPDPPRCRPLPVMTGPLAPVTQVRRPNFPYGGGGPYRRPAASVPRGRRRCFTPTLHGLPSAPVSSKLRPATEHRPAGTRQDHQPGQWSVTWP